MNHWLLLFKLFGWIALAAVALTGLGLFLKKRGYGLNEKLDWPILLIQNFVGALFIFSGSIKAIDPMGTAIKTGQYFDEFERHFPAFLNGLWHSLSANAISLSVFMIVLEIVLGVFLLLGIWRKFTLWTIVLLMLFFTFLTGFTFMTGYVPEGATFFQFGKWAAFSEGNMKVTDCGCFGDFLLLKPWVSFGKDLILNGLIVILIIFYARHAIWVWDAPRKNIVTSRPTWFIAGILTLSSLLFNLHNFYWDEPIVDFRAFYNGVNIPKAVEDCMAKPEKAIMYYVYKSDETGEEVKVSSKELMQPEFKYLYDGTRGKWTAQTDKTEKVVLEEGCHSKVMDFHLYQQAADTVEQSEVTDYVTENPEYNFLVVVPHLNKTSEYAFKEKINPLAAAAEANKTTLYVVCGDGYADIEAFRTRLQCAYPFLSSDEVVLKTMCRSSPGIFLFKAGTIVKKWHWRKLPTFDQIKGEYFK